MINNLFKANQAWASEHKAMDENYFVAMSKSQAPEYLWIGCSDSRIPAESLLGLEPGELFVHRNIANQVNVKDSNSMSVIQYAVNVLKVRHIIVCGHIGCGGVKAALNKQCDGYLENWLQPLIELAEKDSERLASLSSEKEKVTLLAELNVRHQVEQLSNHEIIKTAWCNDQPLQVHGWLFSVASGLLKNLDISRAG